MDAFKNEKVHFLDLENSDSGIHVYRNSTHTVRTGQYTNFHSFEPLSHNKQLGLNALLVVSGLNFVVIYQTKKISYFLPKQDKIPDLERSDVVYKFLVQVVRQHIWAKQFGIYAEVNSIQMLFQNISQHVNTPNT